MSKTKDNKLVLEYMASKGIPLLEENEILEEVQASCEMACVSVNGQCIMMGNYWDFHPGCHGLKLPEFSSPSSLVTLFNNAIKSEGKEVKIVVDETWKYDEDDEDEDE